MVSMGGCVNVAFMLVQRKTKLSNKSVIRVFEKKRPSTGGTKVF